MANNVFAGFNVVIAKQTISFADAGINSSNTNIIIRIRADSTVAYSPTRSLNGITAFEANEGYYIIAKTDMDLSAIVSRTVEAGTSTAGAILTEDGSPITVEP